MTQKAPLPTNRILRAAEVHTLTGLGRTALHRLEQAGRFPRRRQITGRAVGYLEREVRAWIESRPEVKR